MNKTQKSCRYFGMGLRDFTGLIFCSIAAITFIVFLSYVIFNVMGIYWLMPPIIISIFVAVFIIRIFKQEAKLEREQEKPKEEPFDYSKLGANNN